MTNSDQIADDQKLQALAERSQPYPDEDVRAMVVADPEWAVRAIQWLFADQARLRRHVDAAFAVLPEDPRRARRELSAARWGSVRSEKNS